jgi:hypothetical protein
MFSHARAFDPQAELIKTKAKTLTQRVFMGGHPFF